MEEELEGHHFLRIHKNYLVNQRYIKEVGKREVYLMDDTVLEMGRDRRAKIREAVLQYEKERIIYRGVVDGNDEFVWVMNLSGECTDTSAKYKIRGYDKNYADSLKSDRKFNIVARMLIPMEECKRFCQEEAGRRFKKKYWNPITIKIAIA